MATPSQAKPVKLMIDDRECTIVFNNRAEFRMGSLDRPFKVSDLNNNRRSWAALVAWIWACLSEEDASDFPTPESLASHIGDEATIKAAFSAFVETYTATLPATSKNAGG